MTVSRESMFLQYGNVLTYEPHNYTVFWHGFTNC